MATGDHTPLTRTMTTTAEQSLQQPPIVAENRRKKCHGRRKEQRFRRQCRRQGMKPATIAKKVTKRFGRRENQNPSTTNAPTTVSNDNPPVRSTRWHHSRR